MEQRDLYDVNRKLIGKTILHYAMVNQNNVKISHRKYIC